MKESMRLFWKVYQWIFAARYISVGHGVHRDGHACVIMFVGRRMIGLTPDGARKIGDQLRTWADHAEVRGKSIHTMRWIVKVTTKDAAVQAAEEWANTKLDEAASSLNPVTSHHQVSEEK